MPEQTANPKKSSREESSKKSEVKPRSKQQVAGAASMNDVLRVVADPQTARPADILALQRRFGNQAVAQLLEGKNGFTESKAVAVQEQPPNRTGLPDKLKTGIESLSGISMEDVNVHYDSPKPAQLNALAYAKGMEIHLAPGQEKHLPHEAWHVVQQKQGRVEPTLQMKTGTAVNDDHGLEHEAEVKGQEALKHASPPKFLAPKLRTGNSGALRKAVAQLQKKPGETDEEYQNRKTMEAVNARVARSRPAPVDKATAATTMQYANSSLPYSVNNKIMAATPQFLGGPPKEARLQGRKLAPLVLSNEEQLKKENKSFRKRYQKASALGMAANIGDVGGMAAGPAKTPVALAAAGARIASGAEGIRAGEALENSRPYSAFGRTNATADIKKLDGGRQVAYGSGNVAASFGAIGAGSAAAMLYDKATAKQRSDAEVRLVSGVRDAANQASWLDSDSDSEDSDTSEVAEDVEMGGMGI